MLIKYLLQTKKEFKLYQKGFTLIETLVAISILTLATLGPLAIAAQGIQSAGYARDQITAFYLAQEGIEYIRYVRDTNSAQDLDWLNGLDSCVASRGTTGCQIDATDLTVAPDTNSFMTYDSEGYFGYNGRTESTFKRSITIFPGDTSDSRKIEVIVNWLSRGLSRSFVLRETIYNLYR